jgi:HaeIII restriction endonuclease
MSELKKTTQTESGRAFEWAVGCTLGKLTGALIIPSAFSTIAEASYAKMKVETQNSFDKAADIAIAHILEKEKILLASSKDQKIIFNSDSAGKHGDVRDVLLHVGDMVLGISCKHNHHALKHSRLSGKCDFIKAWGVDDNGCSNEYWSKVTPLFSKLTKLRKDSKQTMLWNDIADKANEYYWPVLNAWAEEIQNLCNQSAEKQMQVCKSIISYLVGKHDFYKVICEGQKRVSILGFNFNNSLATRKTKYPDSIYAIDNKNGGQYSKTIVFNHGYNINFRIHSASSRVEPSLKFDVTAKGLPVHEVYQQTFDIVV